MQQFNDDNINNLWRKEWFQFIKKNPNKPWDFDCLSANPSITWDIVKDNPDVPWNFALLSANPNITWDIVKDNPDKPWDFELVSANEMSAAKAKYIEQLTH